MNFYMKKYFLIITTLTLFLASCVKKVEDVGAFDVTVEFRPGNSKYVTTDVTVNPKDSIYFDFKISSPNEDISYVEIQKNGVRIDTFRMNGFADKRNFSFVKGYRADSAAGDYSYRVLARDARAVFMGDGGKLLTVTTRADFSFYSARLLRVPDTVEKKNKTYYSIADSTTYSYTEAAPISNRIDFGYYYDTTRVMAGSPATLQPKGHTIYALTNTVTPFLPYDISTWTKNATIFKASSVSFTSLTSAGAIRTAAVSALTSGTVTRFSQTDRAAAQITNLLTGQVLVFKTASGKYGALNVFYTNNNGPNKDSYIQIDLKIEK